MTARTPITDESVADASRPETPDWVTWLAPWRAGNVLDASDVHIAATLARLAGLDADDGDVVLAVALAARAPRHGQVCLDLDTVRLSVEAETDGDADRGDVTVLAALPWPTDIEAWRARIVASTLATVEAVDAAVAPSDGAPPLVLVGDLLYLERYRVYEGQVSDELLRRAAEPPTTLPVSSARRDELFVALGLSSEQRAAAELGATRPLSVIVGGPGTGKTHTVAALLALLLDGAGDEKGRRRVALVAPTGKAAARMGESIRERAEELRLVPGTEALVRQLDQADTSTIHRLLGWLPDTIRFRHDQHNPLRYDVVIVDETSMVSLPLMARLLAAVGPRTRLVLVGDPGQLASVEAGSVLGDIAGVVADATAAGRPTPAGPLAASVSVLVDSHRFPSESPIGRLAAAVRVGDADAAIEVLHGVGADSSDDSLVWRPSTADSGAGVEVVRAAAFDAAVQTRALAAEGESRSALDQLAAVRVLCAHRRGPYGVARWNWLFEDWLAAGGPRLAGFYVGRPVLVTANDRSNKLFNGDLGVVVDDAGAVRVAFPLASSVRLVSSARLEAVETVHAMTIHKSQGSEFVHVVVVLPPPESRLATRELLYTAVTRARERVTLVGSEASLRAAIERRVRRASGLGPRLWPADG
jgi:exodeoxyribonuclease V alpha subunit